MEYTRDLGTPLLCPWPLLVQEALLSGQETENRGTVVDHHHGRCPLVRKILPESHTALQQFHLVVLGFVPQDRRQYEF
jgi:hypothetical protein